MKSRCTAWWRRAGVRVPGPTASGAQRAPGARGCCPACLAVHAAHCRCVGSRSEPRAQARADAAACTLHARLSAPFAPPPFAPPPDHLHITPPQLQRRFYVDLVERFGTYRGAMWLEFDDPPAAGARPRLAGGRCGWPHSGAQRQGGRRLLVALLAGFRRPGIKRTAALFIAWTHTCLSACHPQPP